MKYKVILLENGKEKVINSFESLVDAEICIQDLVDEILCRWDAGDNRAFIFKAPQDNNDKKYIHEIYTIGPGFKDERHQFTYFIRYECI